MVDLCWLLASQNSAAVLKVEATANHMLNFRMQELGSNVKTRSTCVHVSQERNWMELTNPWWFLQLKWTKIRDFVRWNLTSWKHCRSGSHAAVVWNDVFVTAGSKCATATATWGAPRCTQWSCMFVWQVRINKHNKHTGTTWYYQIYPNLPISAAFRHFHLPASRSQSTWRCWSGRLLGPLASIAKAIHRQVSTGVDFFQLFHIVYLEIFHQFSSYFLVFCLPFFHIFHLFHVTRQESPDPKPRISESFATQWTLTSRNSSKCRGLAALTARIFSTWPKQMRSFKNIFRGRFIEFYT